jgi:hypothetical protein
MLREKGCGEKGPRRYKLDRLANRGLWKNLDGVQLDKCGKRSTKVNLDRLVGRGKVLTASNLTLRRKNLAGKNPKGLRLTGCRKITRQG